MKENYSENKNDSDYIIKYITFLYYLYVKSIRKLTI